MNSASLYRSFETAALRVSGWQRAETGRRQPGIIILAYHDVGELPPDLQKNYIYNVGSARFREQMRFLQDTGLPVISLQDALNRLTGEKPLDRRYVVLTFDDGYHRFMANALPVLREFGFPATVFVTSGFLNRREPFPWLQREFALREDVPNWHPLTEADLRAMAENNLIEIGSHSHSHSAFGQVPAADFIRDVAESVRRLRDVAGRPIVSFSFPFSFAVQSRGTPPNLAQIDAGLADLGLTSAATTLMGLNSRKTPLFRLRRIQVKHYDSPALFGKRLLGNAGFLGTMQQMYNRILKTVSPNG